MGRLKQLGTSAPETFSEELVEGYAYQTAEEVFSNFRFDNVEDSIIKEALNSTMSVVKMSIVSDAIMATQEMLFNLATKAIGRAVAVIAGLGAVNALMDNLRAKKGRAATMLAKMFKTSQSERIQTASLIMSTADVSSSGLSGVMGAGSSTASQLRGKMDTIKIKDSAINDNRYNLELAKTKKQSDLEVYLYKNNTGTWQNTDIDKALWNRVTGKYSKVDLGAANWASLVDELNKLCLSQYYKDAEGKIVGGTCDATMKHVTALSYGGL